jgi:hypothetical protein
MSDISLINTADYKCYYSIDGTSDFKLYTPTPSGDIEYTEYDTFTSVDKTIIAFKELDPFSGDFNYILVHDNKESIIDAICYDDILEFISRDTIREDSWFTVCKSIITDNNTPDHDSIKNTSRCDTGKYGPFKMIMDDGVSLRDRDGEIFKHTNKVTVLLSVADSGYIVSGRNPVIGTSFRDWPAVVCFSKTITGILKLVIEWASLVDSPFNDESEIALVCKDFITSLNIPNNVLNEISEYQEDMPVYRYIKGESVARHGFTEQANVGPLFLNWIKSTHRYRTLNALVHNHPSPPVVPEEVLSSERQYIESKVYEICIKNDIDLTSSPLEILAQIAPFTDLTLSQWITDTNHVKSYIAYS